MRKGLRSSRGAIFGITGCGIALATVPIHSLLLVSALVAPSLLGPCRARSRLRIPFTALGGTEVCDMARLLQLYGNLRGDVGAANGVPVKPVCGGGFLWGGPRGPLGG